MIRAYSVVWEPVSASNGREDAERVEGDSVLTGMATPSKEGGHEARFGMVWSRTGLRRRRLERVLRVGHRESGTVYGVRARRDPATVGTTVSSPTDGPTTFLRVGVPLAR
jgi:hypothetical protein